MILNVCNDYGIISIIKILRTIFLMFQIIMPTVFVVSFGIVCLQAVTHGDIRVLQEAKKKIVNMLIAALIVVFLPILVDIVMSMTLMKDTFRVAECWDVSKNQELFKNNINSDNDDEQSGSINTLIIDPEDYKGKGTETPSATGLRQKIIDEAKNQAWPLGTSSSTYKKKYYKTEHSADCGAFATMVFTQAYGKKGVPNLLNIMTKNKESASKINTKINKYGLTAVAWDGNMSSVEAGDFMTYKKSGDTSNGHGQHIMIYLGKTNDGKYLFSEASHTKHYYGHLSTKKSSAGQLKKSNYAYYYVFKPN